MDIDQPKMDRQPLVHTVESKNPRSLQIAAMVKVAIPSECPSCDRETAPQPGANAAGLREPNAAPVR